MKLYYSIIALLIVQLTFSQLIDLSEDQLLKSGNVFLKKFNSIFFNLQGFFIFSHQIYTVNHPLAKVILLFTGSLLLRCHYFDVPTAYTDYHSSKKFIPKLSKSYF